MRLRKDLVLRKVGVDYIIVDPGQEMVDMTKVLYLNESAAWLWEELLGADFTSEKMVELLMKRYEAIPEHVQKDVESLIGVFEKNGLLEE